MPHFYQSHRLCSKQVRKRFFDPFLDLDLFFFFYYLMDWWYWSKHSILYNRGVYPEESFTKVKKYGLSMLVTQDEGVKSFIANLTSQLSGRFFDLIPVKFKLFFRLMSKVVSFSFLCLWRMVGSWKAAEDCSCDHEQGHLWGAWEMEFQHRDWLWSRWERVKFSIIWIYIYI